METNNPIIRNLSKHENKFAISHYVNNGEIRIYFNPENTTSKKIISSINNYDAVVEALRLANNCLKEVAGTAYEYTSVKADIEKVLNQVKESK